VTARCKTKVTKPQSGRLGFSNIPTVVIGVALVGVSGVGYKWVGQWGRLNGANKVYSTLLFLYVPIYSKGFCFDLM
jgi:hypothetical protein